MRSLPATGLAEAHAVYGISLDPVSARLAVGGKVEMSVEKQIEELEDFCRRMTLVYGGEPGWITLGRDPNGWEVFFFVRGVEGAPTYGVAAIRSQVPWLPPSRRSYELPSS